MENKDENYDDYYTGEYASPEIQKKAESFMKELREQYEKDPDSIYSRPDNILCDLLLRSRDSKPGEKIRLLKIKPADYPPKK